MNKYKRLAAVMLVMILVLSGCSKTTPTSGNKSESFKTITIGALLPLTGMWCEPGQSAQKAYKVGLPQVNAYLKNFGIQFKLDIRDTGSNAEKALQELQAMHKAGINTVLGPMSSEEAIKVLDFADKNSMLLLSPSATSTDLSLKDNFFRMAATDAIQVDALTQFMNTKYQVKQLLAVYVDDTYGRGYYSALQKSAGALNIKMLGAIALPVASPDYGAIAAQLQKLAAGTGSEETAVVLVSSGSNAVDLIKNIPTDSKLASLKWFCGADIIGSKSFLGNKAVADFAVKTRMEGMTVGYKDLSLDALPYIDQLLQGATDLSPYALTSWDSLWLLAETCKETPQISVDSLKIKLPEVAKRYRNASAAINVMDKNGDTLGARFMYYQLEREGTGYTWRCLGHYVNPGFGKPIIQKIKWTVSKDTGVVQIGVLLPLTGSLAEDGQDNLAILKYAAERFNQYAQSCGSALQLKLVVADTGSDPLQAKAAVKKMIDAGIKNMIGLISSSELEKVKPLVDASGAIVISPQSTAPSLSVKDRIYRLVLNDTVQAKAIAELMKHDGKTNVVLLQRNDTYGRDLAQAFKNCFAGNITVVTYDPTQPDYNSLVQSAEIAVQKGTTSETAVLAVSYSEIADILKLAKGKSALCSVRWYGSDGNALAASLIKNQGIAQTALKVKFTAPDYTPYGKYFAPLYQVINYELKPARPFKESSVSSFDGLWLLGCAYLENGVSADTSVINNYVGKHSFCGVGGVLALDENGDRRFGYYKFYQVKDNQGKTSWQNNALYSVDYANPGKLE